MGDFRKPRFGGEGRGGGYRPGGRPSFGDRKELFQATCSNCNKSCEVPFRPNGKKPVFCKDCFVRPEGDAPRSFDRSEAPRTFERRDAPRSFDREERPRREERPSFQPPAAKATPDPRIDALKRDVEALTAKVETVIEILRSQALSTAVQKAVKPIAVAKSKTKSVKKK